MRRHQSGGDDTGKSAAERHEADGYQRERRAILARRRLGIDRNKVGNNATDAEAGEEAQPGKLLKIGRVGGGEGKYAEQQISGNQRDLAAVAVADPSEQGRPEQNTEEAGA